VKFEKYTVKAREAISDAQQLAGRLGNPEIRPGHLLATLLVQEEGIIGTVVKDVGASLEALETKTAGIIDGYSKVSGGQKAGLSRDFQTCCASSGTCSCCRRSPSAGPHRP